MNLLLLVLLIGAGGYGFRSGHHSFGSGASLLGMSSASRGGFAAMPCSFAAHRR